MSYSAPANGAWSGQHHSMDNLTGGWMTYQGAPTTTTAWGVQYRAVYIPIRVPRPCVVRELGYIASSTSSGNIDIGLYDAAGSLLVSSGATTKSTSFHSVEITDTTIGRGLYYVGLCNDTTTDTFLALTAAAPLPAAWGVRTETLGSVALPSSATWEVAQSLGFVPVVAVLLVTEL